MVVINNFGLVNKQLCSGITGVRDIWSLEVGVVGGGGGGVWGLWWVVLYSNGEIGRASCRERV